MNQGKIGVVDVGGGFRGVYAAGVMDYCMDHHIQFDVGIGVSAGSTKNTRWQRKSWHSGQISIITAWKWRAD